MGDHACIGQNSEQSPVLFAGRPVLFTRRTKRDTTGTDGTGPDGTWASDRPSRRLVRFRPMRPLPKYATRYRKAAMRAESKPGRVVTMGGELSKRQGVLFDW